MTSWLKAASVDDFERESVRHVELAGRDIALYRCGNDFFASSNICTHAHALLSDGFLDGFEIECPLHGARFDCRTGESITGPADEDLVIYPVRLQGDTVEIQVATAGVDAGPSGVTREPEGNR